MIYMYIFVIICLSFSLRVEKKTCFCKTAETVKFNALQNVIDFIDLLPYLMFSTTARCAQKAKTQVSNERKYEKCFTPMKRVAKNTQEISILFLYTSKKRGTKKNFF